MGLYERWCEPTKKKNKRKHYWTYVEKDGGRDEVREDLAETIRSHYDRLERIADDVERLGYGRYTKPPVGDSRQVACRRRSANLIGALSRDDESHS